MRENRLSGLMRGGKQRQLAIHASALCFLPTLPKFIGGRRAGRTVSGLGTGGAVRSIFL